MIESQLLVVVLTLLVLAECIQEAIKVRRVFLAGVLCFFVVVLAAITLSISGDILLRQ